ncbi:hypothetical protein [Emticicia agri]|uniref:Uncharacterized protein n=1 Tax=Emticicia agri TaxID=2492393 RepID=A0A4Q5M114_9BACT|nr:hypothetical protein [Emticicia agri]RYU95868.1 hypothetical protein EWM59_09595 [Emticicia agri]
MAKVETPADRYVRLLKERHGQITSSPEKSKQFLQSIGLTEVVKNTVSIKSPAKRSLSKTN